MKRIEIIDSLRGIAILATLVFHSSYYWKREISVQEYNTLLQNPIAMIFLIFGKFAGRFAIITGIANSYCSFYKVDQQGKKSMSIFKTTMISGLWIIVISKIQSIFFNHTLIGNPFDPYPNGPKYYTLITGSIQTGKIQLPSHFLIFY